jgi:hypothetical protein
LGYLAVIHDRLPYLVCCPAALDVVCMHACDAVPCGLPASKAPEGWPGSAESCHTRQAHEAAEAAAARGAAERSAAEAEQLQALLARLQAQLAEREDARGSQVRRPGSANKQGQRWAAAAQQARAALACMPC